jgi:hypothetical protein
MHTGSSRGLSLSTTSQPHKPSARCSLTLRTARTWTRRRFAPVVPGMAVLGMAVLGMAVLGMAVLGMAVPEMAVPGMAVLGMAVAGLVRGEECIPAPLSVLRTLQPLIEMK